MNELIYNEHPIHIQNEKLSLTDMWRAAGGPKGKEPAKWRELPGTSEFIEHVSTVIGLSDNAIIHTVRGNNAGTWAHWQIGLAYAKYLSHDFHMWGNQAIREKMEGRAASLPSPAEIGQGVIEAMLAVATKWKVPTHYALQVAGAEAVRQSGMPWDRLLTQSSYMTDVPNEEVMLEPTELGKLFDLSAVAMNRKLAELGLQEKVGGSWIPTTEGERLCVRHAWVRGGKAGYNLKWSAREIEKLMETEEEMA